MHKTTFAGLTELDPNDPITVDGSSFTETNPRKTDFYLRIGAVTHRHDAHPQIPDPAGVPSASVQASGGQIPAGTDIFVGYTLIDSDGGETRRSTAVEVTTGDTPNGPSAAISATFDSTGGSLPVGQYIYALTLNDAGGGETMLGPAAFMQRQPGYASGRAQLSGLAQELGAQYISWNLWRAQDGGDFQVIATQQTANTFTDTGLICTDAARTPPNDMSGVQSTSTLLVTLPTGAQDSSLASAVSFGLYLSTDGSFANPCLYGDYPLASGGHVISIPALILSEGAPPSVSTASQGANKINPDTDILNWPWKRPVPSASMLPMSGNADGDMREALDTHTLYAWNGATDTWVPGGGAVGSAGVRGSLWYVGHGAPGAISGQRDSDLYLDVDSGTYYQLVSGTWTSEGTLADITVQSNAQTANYTLVLTDAGKVIEMNVAGANTVTIPPNASVAFPIGTVIEICQVGAGQTQVLAGAGVTLDAPGALSHTVQQWSTIGLRKRATNEWVLSGDLV